MSKYTERLVSSRKYDRIVRKVIELKGKNDTLQSENERLREVAELAYQRFSDQNGRISQDEWNANYLAMKNLREALAEPK